MTWPISKNEIDLSFFPPDVMDHSFIFDSYKTSVKPKKFEICTEFNYIEPIKMDLNENNLNNLIDGEAVETTFTRNGEIIEGTLVFDKGYDMLWTSSGIISPNYKKSWVLLYK